MKKQGHSLDVLVSLALFALFTVCVLMVLMLGVNTYRGVVSSVEETYQSRTCLQYIATKVGHYSGENAVTVTQFGDGDALALKGYFDGEEYVTYLYAHEGMLMELFCATDVILTPADGFSVLEIDELSVEAVASNLLEIACTNQGQSATVLVSVHNGEGGVA